MATASPRRRVNQSEMSAAIGAKTADVPSRPERMPRAAQNCQNSSAKAAPAMPPGRPTQPISTGTSTPKRSASRPMITPPTPPVSISIM